MSAVVTESTPKIPNFLSLILITILGISLAKLMWLVLTPEKIINTQIQQVSQTNNTTKQKVNYGKLIANQHLFGQVKKVAAPVKSTPKVAPVKTVQRVKLNLKLHGIVAYKSKDGFALISSNNGRQKVYAKGDELEKAKGVTVLEILPTKVVLNNNGQTEELLLPVKENKNKPKKAGGYGKFDPNKKYKDYSASNLPPNSPPPRMNQQPSRNSVPNLENFRQQVMANPRKLMDIASTSPAVVGGKFKGFRIQPGRERKLFRQLGFRPNDIITEVNGIVIDSAGKGAMVLGELAQATEISVTVLRGGQQIFIQHSF